MTCSRPARLRLALACADRARAAVLGGAAICIDCALIPAAAEGSLSKQRVDFPAGRAPPQLRASGRAQRKLPCASTFRGSRISTTHTSSRRGVAVAAEQTSSAQLRLCRKLALCWPSKLASARSWLPLAPHAEASGKMLTNQQRTSLEVARGARLASCPAHLRSDRTKAENRMVVRHILQEGWQGHCIIALVAAPSAPAGSTSCGPRLAGVDATGPRQNWQYMFSTQATAHRPGHTGLGTCLAHSDLSTTPSSARHANRLAVSTPRARERAAA